MTRTFNGFGAAADTYFGKPLQQLSTAQMAMLAGLPKAPSSFNPIVNPRRAKERQLYVLSRMNQLGYLSGAEFEKARDEDIQVRPDVKPEPPGTPTGTFGDGSVALTWGASTTEGSPVSRYTVEISPAAGGPRRRGAPPCGWPRPCSSRSRARSRRGRTPSRGRRTSAGTAGRR